MDGAEIPRKIDLTEVLSMLEQRVLEWTEQWEQEGEAKFLLRLLERKFGDLADWVLKRVKSAKAEQLLEWGERVLTASSLEEVFRTDDRPEPR